MKEITVKNLYTSGKHLKSQKITIDNGIIQNITPCNPEHYDYENLAPALVDIHLNGGEEYHFTASPTLDALEDIDQASQKKGVAYVLPALITSSPENILKAIEAT
ncbi:hypothetical protein [Elizabethkingia sp. JS20170427COW]|uniref:hypothetical protein n=1 Tax=Elizabethkingia sp. JS20170427COW TaxID=2583851 RepID=UPI001110D187|nr:hypothetical protein [Elizabethkingia sp. JS20170427COW]QCX52284.1 hypothetical protein FGE20_00235 [Elizabethkingia sp. JS20170427COW]